MKTVEPASIRMRHWSVLCLVCFTGLMLFSYGQENIGQVTGDAGEYARTERDFTIRIGVEEVRLDAVVLDKKGHQITDLTADDFEIYQDYFRQKVVSCVYINDYQPQLQKLAVSSKDSSETPSIPVPALTKENVRRTIVFVVDNLVMDFAQVNRARVALGKFVEKQMQDGDLVAVVPTAGGNATFQTFSSDRKQLLSIISNVRWFIDWRTTQITSQMMAMAYSIRTLRDMPGRKALILVSPSTMIPSPLVTEIGRWLSPAQRAVEYTEATFNPLADSALRAGVVIHTLDIRGLAGPPSIDAEQGFDYSILDDSGTLDPGKVSEKASIEVATRDTQTPIPLSKKTGGLFIRDSNWFVNGIGPVQEELKGYYMLTYIPPASTFRADRGIRYHKIEVRVKRPGSVVHSRDGFYGVPAPADQSSGIPNSLYSAIFSPFQYNDLKISLTSGYVDDPQKGYLLKSSLYLDARDLSIPEGRDGVHPIEIVAASVTSDINNVVKDSNAKRYEFSIKTENIPWLREHGIKFSLSLPVKKPGSYYVRTALRDTASGKMGSAYQYIEIPDLRKNRLSLSDIFIINRTEDLPWVTSSAPEEFRTALYPDLKRDPRKSPALRSFQPGDHIESVALIYNAKTEKGKKPDLEYQFILYGNGRELFKSNFETVDLSSVSDFERIPLKIKMRLTDSMQPGDYVLQLLVRDNGAKKKQNLAVQTLDLKVLAKQGAGS
jgi:VWFA-related protein